MGLPREHVNQVYLYSIAFFCGLTIMGVEMSAGRLMAPFFGTSILVWTVIISSTMIALTLGYYLGGVLAEKYRNLEVLCSLLLIASLIIMIIPYLVQPFMESTLTRFGARTSTEAHGGVLATLVVCSLLISFPLIILGMTSPFIIRLATIKDTNVGIISGKVFAFSTVGSILGTLLPALVLIPAIGTRLTFCVFGSIVAFVVIWSVAKPKLLFMALFLLVFTLAVITGITKKNARTSSHLISEKETNYELVQIYKSPYVDELSGEKVNANLLITDAAFGIQSLFLTGKPYTDSWQDFFVVMAKVFEASSKRQPKRILICGLGGAIAPYLISNFYPDCQFDGVEIDGQLIETARPYFPVGNMPNLNVFIGDARFFTRTNTPKYDVIIVDTFKPPHIPFHIGTLEFFDQLKSMLNDGGVVGMNIGSGDKMLVFGAISNTLASTFEYVYSAKYPSIPTDPFTNRFVVASSKQLGLEEKALEDEVFSSKHQAWETIFQRIRDSKNLNSDDKTFFKRIPFDPEKLVLTDDNSSLDSISEREFFGLISGTKSN